ncbi:MAG TPA: MBL fold metallo-hydrolase, partial [Chloroflexota bacterium]|nr:MBL fold metallo-hydrolase [Chloroflexota bacterium]
AHQVLANRGELLAHRIEDAAGRRLGFDEDWLLRNGLPSEALHDVRWHTADWPTPTRLLEDGDQIRWGPLDLQVVWCPGHTRGLVCLFEPRRGLLFTTDHVMRRAPAPVTVREPGAADPLGDYLVSVRKLAPLRVSTVLPGHGRPFGDLGSRLTAIEADIEAQLDNLRKRLSAGPASAYELLAVKGLRDRRSVAERYALSLVLARLRHLEVRGEIVRADRGTAIRYARYSSPGSS